MFHLKRVGLLGRLVLVLVLALMIFQLVSVRHHISAAKATAERLSQQVDDQTQSNTELSNAIENRDNPNFVEDIARERLGLVSPNDRIFYITD